MNARILWALAILGLARSSDACAFDPCGAWTLNGSAVALPAGEIQLTQDASWLGGSAWSNGNVDLAQNFDLSVQMYFGTHNGTDGADGITFVLQNDPRGRTALGSDGGDIGLGGYPVLGGAVGATITPSVAVEFDTYQNSAANPPLDNDPGYDHVLVDENGNIAHLAAGACPGPVVTASGSCPVQASALSPVIRDGFYHSVKFKWDAAAKVLQVFFDASLRLTYSRDIAVFLGTSCAYLGFTASTGGSSNDQRVRFACPASPTPTSTPTQTPGATFTPVPCGNGLDLLADPGFENPGTDVWGSNGSPNPNSFHWSIPQSSFVHAGAQAAEADCSSGCNGKSLAFYQTVNGLVNGTYTVEIWIYSKNSLAAGGEYFEASGYGSALIMSTPPSQGIWTKYDFTVNVSTGTLTYAFGINGALNNNFYVAWDDASLSLGGGPCPSPTATATPSMRLIKSVSASTATLGDTITFCLQWLNDSSAATSMRLWDTVPAQLTYVGSNGGGSLAGGVVSWSFPAASGGSGTVCFWGKVSGYP